MSVDKRQRDGNGLPVALQYAADNILLLHPQAREKASAILAAYGPHRLPPRFEAILNRYDVR
jgi:hypothetical protein